MFSVPVSSIKSCFLKENLLETQNFPRVLAQKKITAVQLSIEELNRSFEAGIDVLTDLFKVSFGKLIKKLLF